MPTIFSPGRRLIVKILAPVPESLSKKFKNCTILVMTFWIECMDIFIWFSKMAPNFQDTSSEDELDVECTQNEKELLDYVLDNYRDGVFELFNIIVRKLDQIQGQKGL